ncbi:hypothetical protein C3F09_02510 [candidate division GN15 bacterium]|uniref:Uncharacterized protein n=1 Tax=candidate division GN15 bacterium TaxID=2072418 RepID=A0A855XB23_9BACT|nr:MAG: hypothetical protein C3F09_02510 [candidate division GN15 bacterium]
MSNSFKPIVAGEFRTLSPEECRVLLIRDCPHQNNLVFYGEITLLIKQGSQLKSAGINLAKVITSPADRSLLTVLYTKVGNECAGHTRTDDRFDDFDATDISIFKRIKSLADERGVSIEQLTYDLVRQSDEFVNILFERGEESAGAIREYGRQYAGSTILIGSHGISRIPWTILRLENTWGDWPDTMSFLEHGQIMEIIYRSTTGSIAERHLLEPLPPPFIPPVITEEEQAEGQE